MYIRSRFHGHEVRYAWNRYVVITRRNEGNGGSLARADNIDTNLAAVKRRRVLDLQKNVIYAEILTGEISVANCDVTQTAPRYQQKEMYETNITSLSAREFTVQ